MSRLDSPNIVLAVVTLSHAVNHMYMGILPLLYTPILNDLGLSYTQLGVIIAVHLFILGVMQFGSSILSRYMPKRILLGLGTILLGVGNFAVGLSQSFLQFLMGRVVAGVGGSPQHPVGTALIAERFKAKARGSALGVHFSFAFAGNILGPVAAGVFLIYLGWRMTLYILMIPALVMGVLAMLLIREHSSFVEEGSQAGVWRDVKKVLTTRPILMLFMAQLFAAGAGQGVLLNYTPIILTDSFGLEPEGVERIFFYVIFLIGGVAGPIVIGRLSDIFGRRVAGIIAPLLTSLLLYLFITAVQPSLVLAGILMLLGVNAFAIPIIIQAI
ncbi:MAG: MFS transporter, partial [Nitrososphaerales archaeon]